MYDNACMYIPAQQNDDGIALCRNESQHKDVLTSTIITFGRRLSQRALGVQNNFLVFRANKVIDDVRRRGVAPGITEPFGTYQTFHNGCWGMDATIADLER